MYVKDHSKVTMEKRDQALRSDAGYGIRQRVCSPTLPHPQSLVLSIQKLFNIELFHFQKNFSDLSNFCRIAH